MAELIINEIVEAGIVDTLVAADVAGDEFVNEDGDVFIVVANADSGAHIVTINPTQSTTFSPGFGTVDRDPIVVSVAAAETKFIGPFPQIFNDINGKVQVAYDGITDVTVGAFKLASAR